MDNPEQKYYQAIYDAGIENYGGSPFPLSDFSLNPKSNSFLTDSFVYYLIGNKTKFNEEIDAFVPGKSKQNETTVGSANGIFSLEKTITTSSLIIFLVE